MPASISTSPLCSLPLARAVCSAVPLSDRIYPRWAAQLTLLICLWAWVCVCVDASPFQAPLHWPPGDWWRHALISMNTHTRQTKHSQDTVLYMEVIRSHTTRSLECLKDVTAHDNLMSPSANEVDCTHQWIKQDFSNIPIKVGEYLLSTNAYV